jgi:hypothetical protein
MMSDDEDVKFPSTLVEAHQLGSYRYFNYACNAIIFNITVNSQISINVVMTI